MIGGPANMISSAISADLGRSPQLHGGKALSTVTGIIDGTGSLGAAIGQTLIGYIQGFGWKYYFLVLLIVCACTLVSLSRMLWNDVKHLKAERQKRKKTRQYKSLSEDSDKETLLSP
eukprot:CAMPEP_0115042800 /NCGR_PEP_ID=MMETSP0216-20121206/46471_1 /TAXON_ID=223996 /ORGANISM="Protocruzia adherens, Strain Boccale" /LENGTH=116 /DNA_ID=CAMNT_0002424963 /DNA_START=106 /DNA_END=456 /DNA_ORIENTATION=-